MAAYRIIIVDDDPLFRDALRLALSDDFDNPVKPTFPRCPSNWSE